MVDKIGGPKMELKDPETFPEEYWLGVDAFDAGLSMITNPYTANAYHPTIIDRPMWTLFMANWNAGYMDAVAAYAADDFLMRPEDEAKLDAPAVRWVH